MSNKGALWFLFILAFFLIGVAYYKGLSTDVSTSGGVLNTLGKTFTGRNGKGNFAAYPTQG